MKIDNLFSGLLGAMITIVIQTLLSKFGAMRQRYSLLKAVRNECSFNLGILDEIAEGIAKGLDGSYKRVKTDFYGELRRIAYQYHFSDELYQVMAQVACDEDLFNLELDKLQTDLDAKKRLLAGKMALCAVNGVRGSLSQLKRHIEHEMSCSILNVIDRIKGAK